MHPEYDFSPIMDEINEAALVEGGLRSDDCNTIPYGTPSACKPVLLSLIDGELPAAEVITRSLMHVGQTCSTVTHTIIFYVKILKSEWDRTWSLFEPAFYHQTQEKGLTVEVLFEQPKPQIQGFPWQDDGEPPSGPCESCKQKPATKKRMDTWTSQMVNMCDECAERFF
ncbi:hypothetical protein E5161_09655 [Cohnella pontilimi]|uniref:Uncharacterized protein n=1 Tax=Cohnella pontilimi TaxID=2564100 RepID=A0A4U0FC20_9BACL|nr:hypothetical protein [Cohnella pontilimi]TJY42261.1 hypothetical protein E5161_09655 [Cohnella pontilimi]